MNVNLQYRYTSRSLLIEFDAPCLDIPMLEYAKLPQLMEKSSSAVGIIISLGERFMEEGIGEMDDDLLPELWRLLAGHAIPRVLPSYAILIWFTLKVCTQLCYIFILNII